MLRRLFARDLSGLTRWLLATVTLAVLSAMLAGYFPPRYVQAWSTDPTVNTPVCTASDGQQFPKVVASDSGGAIIAWQDSRSGNADIYAQWMDSAGTVKWTVNGVPICTASDKQESAQVVSDGSGGAIITWQDNRSGNADIYAQRIDSAGTARWTVNGVTICNASNPQINVKIISDGSGGAIITWQDYRTGDLYNPDIYAQRIDAAGTVKWALNGAKVSAGSLGPINPEIASDGSGGAIITWQDYRSTTNWDVYVQRVDAAGTAKWTANGMPVCTASDNQELPQAVSDGSGGAIIAWQDNRGGNIDLYAQRVGAASGASQWTGNGVTVCNAGNTQGWANMTSDGSGGAIIAWQDYRTNDIYDPDIYVQRVNASGEVKWAVNGTLCAGVLGAINPELASDGSGGAVITWQDFRSTTNWDVYAQRVNASGALRSPPNTPVVLSPVPGERLLSSSNIQLQASAFEDQDGDTHEATQWQIATLPGDYGAPSLIHDSMQTSGERTKHAVPGGVIDVAKTTTYYWRVRYKDSYGEWSAWSEGSFILDVIRPVITIQVPQVPFLKTNDRTPNFAGAVTNDDPIARVEYRVDGGDWQAAAFAAVGGDPKSVEFSFSTFLTLGEYEVEIRAVDTFDQERSVVISVVVESKGISIWVIVLIVLGGLLLMAGAGYLIWRYQGKIKEKSTQKVSETKQKLGE